MKPTILYEKNYHIDLRDVDFQKKLKLSALFSYFQDAANDAAIRLGVGIDTLQEKFDAAWVLMRLKVDIERLPSLDEEITIETWPQEPRRFDFERDFLVKDRDGNIIIRAISSWGIIDLKERKLVKASAISLEYPEVIEERAIHGKLRKLKGTDPMHPVYKKVIGYSDIDFNGHLNNSRYIDYMMDCFPIEDHEKYQPESLEVNFINEALPGDEIVMKQGEGETSGEIIMEGVREKDDTVIFRAKVKIKEI